MVLMDDDRQVEAVMPTNHTTTPSFCSMEEEPHHRAVAPEECLLQPRFLWWTAFFLVWTYKQAIFVWSAQQVPISMWPQLEIRRQTTTTSSSSQPRPLFVTDPLCQGCRSARYNQTGFVCVDRLRYLQEQNASWTAYQKEVGEGVGAQSFVECSRCHLQACRVEQKQYWRLDRLAPPTRYAVTHFLSSEKRRLPETALHNVSSSAYYFHNVNHTIYPRHSYYFESNPSIVQIPNSQNIPIQGEWPTYLASFRVTDTPCGQPTNGRKHRPHDDNNLLGLAWLRHDLTILADSIIDTTKEIRPGFRGNYRLFVLQEEERMYLTTNKFRVAVWLRPPDAARRLTPLSSSGPEVPSFHVGTVNETPNVVQVAKKAKNALYWVDTTTNLTVMQAFPTGRLQVVDFLEQDASDSVNHPSTTLAARQLQETLNGRNTVLPRRSMGSVVELFFAQSSDLGVLTPERGSACCVEVQYKGMPLLLGISQSQARFRRKKKQTQHTDNPYFSTFYAMENVAPYNVVAVSGQFCLGFSQPNEVGGNPHSFLNRNKIVLGNNDFDCPRVHYVSGMVESAMDSSRMIIAYGINDCTPRMVEVSKADVLGMLFPEDERRDTVSG